MNREGRCVAMQIISNDLLDLNKDYEIVERKGIGHPDTLADELAERLSTVYSRYCQKQFGVILHHNFDKVGMMGGISEVGFGTGKIKSPIRVLLNGRASSAFGSKRIELQDMLYSEVDSFFTEKFPHIEKSEQIYTIMWEVACGSSPGAVAKEDSYRHHWFSPRGVQDLSELKYLNCNDTSMGCAYFGNTLTEQFVLQVEKRMNSKEFKENKPWMGSDIKIMCCRFGKEISITLCVPQISIFVETLIEYKHNLEMVENEIHEIASLLLPSDYDVKVNLNMRDKFDSSKKDLYLTYSGSSIEMGDEGFVGRGNRIGGLITPNRFYSMEGIAGKNPVYHTGKMYSVFAYEIAKRIMKEYNVRSEVILVGMTGHPLMTPYRVVVNSEEKKIDMEFVLKTINDLRASEVTEKILKREYVLF